MDQQEHLRLLGLYNVSGEIDQWSPEVDSVFTHDELQKFKFPLESYTRKNSLIYTLTLKAGALILKDGKPEQILSSRVYFTITKGGYQKVDLNELSTDIKSLTFQSLTDVTMPKTRKVSWHITTCSFSGNPTPHLGVHRGFWCETCNGLFKDVEKLSLFIPRIANIFHIQPNTILFVKNKMRNIDYNSKTDIEEVVNIMKSPNKLRDPDILDSIENDYQKVLAIVEERKNRFKKRVADIATFVEEADNFVQEKKRKYEEMVRVKEETKKKLLEEKKDLEAQAKVLVQKQKEVADKLVKLG